MDTELPFGTFLAGAALVIYYCLAPSIFRGKTSLKMLSLAGSFFGIMAGLSFIGVAFTPANVYLAPHALFVQLAFVTYFVAVSIYAAAIFIHPGFANKYGWVNLTFGILLGIYVWLLFYGPGTSTQSGLVIQVTGQKLIAYAAVACMFVAAYGSRQLLEQASSAPQADLLPENQPAGS
ncbi:MAG: hypothetical protein ACWGO1_09190, partial [Anaerolineales bacterium]